MKIITLVVALILLLSLPACKKSFTCECVTTSGGTVTNYSSVTINDTKKKAEATCSEGTASTTTGSYTVATSCELK
jgi:hypothetical protein